MYSISQRMVDEIYSTRNKIVNTGVASLLPSHAFDSDNHGMSLAKRKSLNFDYLAIRYWICLLCWWKITDVQSLRGTL